FQMYARVFLRYSLTVSRAQELEADAISARVAGQEAAAQALVTIEERSALWELYFSTEVIPMLEEGFLPQLLKAVRLCERGVRERLPEGKAAPTSKTSEYDTHPSLEERLAALGAEHTKRVEPGSTALSLIGELEQAEEYVLRSILVDSTRKL